MKKLIMTIAIVLAIGMTSFAQEEMMYEERGLFGKGFELFRNSEDEVPMIDFAHGETEDQDANGPLGSGIVVLMSLGAAYLVGKKRKEE